MVPDVTSSLWRSISVFSVFPWRSVSVSSSFGDSVPFFLVLAFLLLHERASPLRHKGLLAIDVFSALASTSTMLAYGFFEMENIKSLDCMPNLAVKAVMANSSFGMSTLNDSELNLWT